MYNSLFFTKLSNAPPPGSPLRANAPWWGPTTCQMPVQCPSNARGGIGGLGIDRAIINKDSMEFIGFLAIYLFICLFIYLFIHFST
jgi:hypothetical protein